MEMYSQGRTILIDEEDFNNLPSNHIFKFDKDGYCLMYWYCKELRKEVSCRLHRWIMHEPKKLVVDHINGIILDNRRMNLRACSVKQNTQNMGPKTNKKGKTSQFKGVCLNAQSKWQAQIKIDNKSLYLGQFLTELEAADVYNKAATKYFGEYAYLNKTNLVRN